MELFSVSSEQDLYALKQTGECYDEVAVDVNRLKFAGLVRHAVKYANYALRTGGLMRIQASPFISYHFRGSAIDFWQIKYEVFNCLKDTIEIEEVNAVTGTLTLRKKKHFYNYSGISFGIVFSGNASEEPQLVSAIESIANNKRLDTLPYEILISGPQNYEPSKILNEFPGVNVKYLSLDIATSPRLLICEKKNYLYEKAQYSLVVITHTRILFTEDFVESLLNQPVEMATPAVYFTDKGKRYKYLDMAFINSYQSIQFGAKRGTIAGENITEDYLHWYRQRVPFIDGGLNVFNKNVITQPPYNNYIAWGEAEDIDVCNRLFQNGILIDYLPSIHCYSATCKVTGYSTLKKIARKLYIHLHKKSIIN